METDQYPEAVFPQIVAGAVADLKIRLQSDYQHAYPELGEIIHLVLDEEEANAWDLSFPHLFLPDLVEAHIAKLNLQPAETQQDDVLMRHDFTEIETHHPAFVYANG
jgi:hypothetical protein